MSERLIYKNGFSIVELMTAVTIALFMLSVMLTVYLVQSRVYKTTTGQGFIQNSENAIATMMSQYIRGAGFAGCSTVANAVSNLNAGGSPPLGNINTAPAAIMGYQSLKTITQLNAANDANVADWSPSLDSTLAGNAIPGSDVLVVLGPPPGTLPTGVTAINNASNVFTVQNATGVVAGQYGAISDCAKSAIFKITGVTGQNISHASGSGSLANSSDTLAVTFAPGAQFISLQQTAFFVGQGAGGQSSLMMATLNGNTWTVQALVPGVDTMKVMYGVGANGALNQYQTAANVTSWGQVYAVRLGFLVEGELASGNISTQNNTQFTLFNQTITVPADNRLRHVYEFTVNVRNNIS